MSRGSLLGLLTLAACDNEPVDTATACEGAGDAEVAVGSGGRLGFEPWAGGSEVPLTQSGSWGFRIEVETRGLDTTQPMSLLTRFLVDDESETQDAGANVTFQCDGEGPGWAGLFVPLGDEDQSEAAAQALSGSRMTLTVAIVDATEDTATSEETYEFVF